MTNIKAVRTVRLADDSVLIVLVDVDERRIAHGRVRERDVAAEVASVSAVHHLVVSVDGCTADIGGAA